MPDILVRGLDARVVKQLKAKAKQNGRSLQGEVKMTLERAAGTEATEVMQIMENWKRRAAARPPSTGPNNLDILREIREQ